MGMKAKLFSAIALVLALVASVRADGLIIIRNPPPRVMPGSHFAFAPLEVVFHKVDVEIAGQKATTRVEQEFFNPNDANLEGEYIFPIPAGAHLDKFTMRVGDKEMEAELLDAAKARAHLFGNDFAQGGDRQPRGVARQDGVRRDVRRGLVSG